MGKMNQILHCDWLPERAKWSYLTRSGLPAVSHKKNCQEGHTINPLMTKCEVNMAGYWFCFWSLWTSTRLGPSSETQGQLVGTTKSLKRAKKKFGRRKLFFAQFFFARFRLFPVPTNCPWVSEDGLGP